MRPGHRPKERHFAGIPPALCFNLDTDGMVSELVAVRNLPYSLAEVSFLSLDSACRSPVATVYFVPFVFSVRGLHEFGSACSSVSLSGAELSEHVCPFHLVVVFQLFLSARRPVAYDRVFPMRFYLVLVLASFGEDITWHRFWIPWIVQVRPAAEDSGICGDEGGVTSLRDGEAPWGHACPSITCL